MPEQRQSTSRAVAIIGRQSLPDPRREEARCAGRSGAPIPRPPAAERDVAPHGGRPSRNPPEVFTAGTHAVGGSTVVGGSTPTGVLLEVARTDPTDDVRCRRALASTLRPRASTIVPARYGLGLGIWEPRGRRVREKRPRGEPEAALNMLVEAGPEPRIPQPSRTTETSGRRSGDDGWPEAPTESADADPRSTRAPISAGVRSREPRGGGLSSRLFHGCSRAHPTRPTKHQEGILLYASLGVGRHQKACWRPVTQAPETAWWTTVRRGHGRRPLGGGSRSRSEARRPAASGVASGSWT